MLHSAFDVHSLKCTIHRKMFGDGSTNSTEPSKRLQITKRTTYRLMEEQRQRDGEQGGRQDGEVCTGRTGLPPTAESIPGHSTRVYISTMDPAECRTHTETSGVCLIPEQNIIHSLTGPLHKSHIGQHGHRWSEEWPAGGPRWE